ncbi:MAG TPA: T9SS type A sorting domain-containing protein, partial [Flavobacteriales bacterium]
RSTVRNNDAADGGGVFLQAGAGSIDLDYSTVSTNFGSANGGGVRSEGGTFNINATTIANNASAHGGGVDINAGTFHSNSSVIADNSAPVGPDVMGAFTTAVFTLVENGIGATGITNGANGNIVGVDPILQPLAANGGLTLTHALSCGSAAIDAGDPMDGSNDQRETPVFGATRDMGAYEVDVECPPAPCTENLDLSITLDASGSETTWELLNEQDEVVASGGPYADGAPGTVVNETVCVPAGCYYLVVSDAGDNGIANGGYRLTDAQDRRIIDAITGQFDGTSRIRRAGQPLPFCVPLSTSRMLPGTCDLPSRKINSPVYASEIPGATMYRFWIFDPHGSYSRRAEFLVPQFHPGYLMTNPVPVNVQFNVCVQVMLNGVWQPYGPVCRYYFVPQNSTAGMVRNTLFDEGSGIALSLYPNPNRTGIVNVSIVGASDTDGSIGIDIVDALGRVVHQERLSASGDDLTHVMDLQGRLGAGLYLVNITMNDQRYTQRLVLE